MTILKIILLWFEISFALGLLVGQYIGEGSHENCCRTDRTN